MKKQFGKKFRNENSDICFYFIGKEINYNINYDQLEKLINNCFEKLKSYDNMVRNVAWIRTILKDFDEKKLEIRIFSNGKTMTIRYINKELDIFRSEQVVEEQNNFKTDYKCGKGISFNFSDSESNIIESPNFKSYSELVKNIIEQIDNLKHVSAIELDHDSKVLYEIYKLFYNSNPDFSSKDINLKMQTMMSILVEFGISLGDDYAFSIWSRIKMPISIKLEELVNKLNPLGEIEIIDNEIKLSDESKKIIKVVGDVIRDYIQDGYDEIEFLVKLSTIMHASRYNLSLNANIEEISKFTNCSTNEVESSIKLVKKIDEKLLRKKV